MAAIQKQARPAAASRWWLPGAALLAVGFGLLTLWSGGNVLFGGEDARAAAGNYVPFVVVFNFAAGFAYVLAASACGGASTGRPGWRSPSPLPRRSCSRLSRCTCTPAGRTSCAR